MTLVEPDRTAGEPLFADNLAGHGDRAAFVTAQETIAYAELDERVAAAAASLGPDRRLVLLEATNAIEPLVAYLAALRGGHPVLLAPGDNAGAVRDLAAAYDPDVVIDASEGWTIAARRDGSAHELHPDLALLLSTSGSTGSSKLVRLSRRNLQANAESIAQYLGIAEDHRAATTLPMQYCYGLSVIHSHLLRGAGLVLTDLSVVDQCFWDLFRAAGATSFAGVPHTFDLLDRVGFATMSLPSLRHVTQAGGRLRPDSVRRYAALGERDGWRFFVMYGQTEATARMAYLPPDRAASHPGAIGIPIPGGSLRIDSPDDDGVGELVYRGPNVMLGYAERPADLGLGATVDALHTGDLAHVTPDGLYELRGRRSRIVKPYGLRIDLDRLERVLAERGMASMCTGDDDRLIVAIEAGTDAPAVARLVAELLALPLSRIHVVELPALPRLANGKPDYAGIQQHATAAGASGDGARPEPANAPPRGPDVRTAFADVLGKDVSDEDSFVSLGGDSLSYVEMSVQLEEVLGSLPRDWHTTPVGQLAPARARRGMLGTRQIETSVVVRAIAIVLIVGTHTELWQLTGGAHLLLGLAGFNFARFQMRATTRAKLAGIARIVVPSMCWIGLVAATTDEFSWPNALLLNSQFGVADAPRDYWFVQSLVAILGLATLVLAVAPVRRLERRWPFGLAVGAGIGALAFRFELLGLEDSLYPFSRPHLIFWLFALGWAAARANTAGRRLVVSVLVLAAVPGFFDKPSRDMIVIGGLLLATWIRTMPVPRPFNRAVGATAAASLAIYLTHWQVYPPLVRNGGPLLACIGSVIVGVAVWSATRRVGNVVRARFSRATGRGEGHQRAGPHRSSPLRRPGGRPSHCGHHDCRALRRAPW
ncbi:MAG: AMP-binding protein [Acidimicrobiales bacterium]